MMKKKTKILSTSRTFIDKRPFLGETLSVNHLTLKTSTRLGICRQD